MQNINDDRHCLLDLKKEPVLGKGIAIVYVYFLIKEFISYPKEKSNILYIGEALRHKEPTGVRLGQHITHKKEEGSDTGSNLVLSQYFYEDWHLGLAIFSTTPKARKRDERNLIYAHISLYGAPPIAQGKLPYDGKKGKGRNRTKHIFDYIANNKKAIANASKILEDIVVEN